jgi:hypothetical protein
VATRFADLSKIWLQAQTIRRNSPEKFHGMISGITTIQQAVKRFRYPTYGVLIAEQKAGKTASLLTLNEMYADQGFTTLFISNEIGPYDMGTRMMANISMTDMDKMEDHQTDENEDIRIDAAISRLEHQDSWFAYNKRTPLQIMDEIKDVRKKSAENWAKQEVGSDKCKLVVFIDYFNLLRQEGNYRSKVEMEEALSHWLQSLTLPPQNDSLTAETMLGLGDSLITIWTASQVPKSEKRGRGKLTANSAKGSTALEDDASYIGVINYVKGKDSNEPIPNMREITWITRYGPGGSSLVHFNGAQARLEDPHDNDKPESLY